MQALPAVLIAMTLTGPVLWSQTCEENLAAGRVALSRTNLVLAKSRFEAAATQCPERDDARFLYALARVLAIPSEPSGSNFLNRIGVPSEGRGIFRWDAWAPSDTNGVWLAPPGVNASEGVAMLRTNILPAISGAAADLASITDPAFSLTLTERETSVTELTVDYGDVLMLRALLHAFEYLGYTAQSWNVDVTLSALRALHDGGMLSVQQVLADYPQLLTFTTTNELLVAKAAFQTAIDRYYEASAVIRAREHNLQRLFTYDFDHAEEEERFRCILASARASLERPTVLCTASNYTLHIARHFDGHTSLRDLLPMFAGDRPIVGTLPDATLGGVIFGLTDIAVEGLLAKFTPMAVLMGNAGVIPPNRFISEFRTLPGRIYALEYSTNLRSWNEISRFYSEGGTYGFVDAGTAEFRYYRLRELYEYYTLSGQVVNSCSGQPIAGALVQVYPFDSVETTDLDGRFELRLPRGYFQAHVLASGYDSEWFQFYLDGNDDDLRVTLEPFITTLPSNDNFANRIALTNFPATAQGWICASEDENDDPVGQGSMWWTWTAPFSGRVTLSLDLERSGTGYLAVFEGASLGNLVRIAGGYTTELRFDAVAGTAYQIAAGRFLGREWTLRLAAAPELTIVMPLDGQAFTAPADIPILVHAIDMDGSVAKVEIFADGDRIAAFTPSGSNEEFTWQNAPPGHYTIRVRATDNLGDTTTVEREVVVRPANDAFANRIVLSGSNVLARATAVAATTEPGENSHAGKPAQQTLWWAWTAPFTGPATLLVNGSGGNGRAIAVYTGSAVSTLMHISSYGGPHAPRQLTFAATTGTEYAIVVSGYFDDVKVEILPTEPPSIAIVAPTNNYVFDAPGNVTVQIAASDVDGISRLQLFFEDDNYEVMGGQMILSNLQAGTYSMSAKATDGQGTVAFSGPVTIVGRVPNDHFTNAIALTGAVVNATGTTFRATRESGEPYHGGYYTPGTIWWSWTAPTSGTVTISTAGSDFDTYLAVYTGTMVNGLTGVAANDDFGDQTSRVTFPVVGGTVYQIVVASIHRSGTARLSIVLQ